MRSPEMAGALSHVPAEKFFVARQPMDCVTLTRNAEPSASSAAMAGWEWMPVASALEAALRAAGSATVTPGPPAAVDDDGLELLGPHDGAEAAARRGAHVVVGGGDQHGGGARAHLAGRAAADERHLVAVLGPQLVDGGEGAEAGELRRRHQRAAVLGDDEHGELVGLPGHLDAAQAQVGQVTGGGAAGVGLFDAAGERALAADREPAAVGDDRAGEDAGREHEHVARAQRVRPGVDLVAHDGRGQPVAAQSLEVVPQRLPGDRSLRKVDVQEVCHLSLTSFPGEGALALARPPAPRR